MEIRKNVVFSPFNRRTSAVKEDGSSRRGGGVSLILVANTSFPELNHLAAALADVGALSCYVRPYATYCNRSPVLNRLPGLGRVFYAHSFGRREMPIPLNPSSVMPVARGWDFAHAVATRLPARLTGNRALLTTLQYQLIKAVAKSAAGAFRGESMVVASWSCAEPVFELAQSRDAICVLNCAQVHHAFSRRYLQAEAKREPSFAATLNSHDRPAWLMSRLDREIALADKILVGSSFAKATFVSEGVPEDKLYVVPYGVDTELFSASTFSRDSNSFRVVFAGQVSQRKGIAYALRAYEAIHAPDSSLTLVGKLQDDGSSLAPWRGIFRYIPHLPRADLARIFESSDVFLFPTLIEGMPIVVLEAMASGLPVITTPNGPGDIVRDGVDGFVVPPRDVDTLVKRLQILKENPDLRKAMGKNAANRAREFSWNRYRENTARLLTQWQT